jgi:hypothetical protein
MPGTIFSASVTPRASTSQRTMSLISGLFIPRTLRRPPRLATK